MHFSYDFKYLSERWFDEATPTNYDEGLAATIGSGTNGSVVITDTTKTELAIVAALAAAGGASASASYAEGLISVELGTMLSGSIGSGTDGVITIVDQTEDALAVVAALAVAGGANASASFGSGVITVRLGTKLSTTIGTGADGTITIVDPTEDALAIEVVLGAGNNTAMSAAFNAGKITVTLGTDGGGAADDAKNTATLVTAAINGIVAKTWTATASGTGATPIAVAASKDATIVINDAKNTATLIVAAINGVAEKTWSAAASGTGNTAIAAPISETALSVIANPAKNTATLVAAAINAVSDKTWTATASGNGTTAIAVFTEAAFAETVVYGTPCQVAGLGLYDVDNNVYYVCTEADNTVYNTHWIKLTPSAV
jgi:hypothetical protein